MNSNEYSSLQTRIQSLESNMLSIIPTDPQESLDEKWYDIIMGYIILSHSAFEDYIETIATRKIDTAIEDFRSTGSVSKILLSLIVYFKIHWPPIEPVCQKCTIGKIFKFARPKKAIECKFDTTSCKNNIFHLTKLYKTYVIKENHGVRASHIKHIILPLGWDKGFDADFEPALQYFCSLRGSGAHSVDKANKKLTALEAKKIVNDILSHFKKLDLEIDAL